MDVRAAGIGDAQLAAKIRGEPRASSVVRGKRLRPDMYISSEGTRRASHRQEGVGQLDTEADAVTFRQLLQAANMGTASAYCRSSLK
jgi:hypothetical protein